MGPFLFIQVMSLPTILAATELGAINQILGAVGQAPVTTLDLSNPDVSIAYQTLVDVNRETQAEGWVFNLEKEYPFLPDNNNEILVPANVLSIDLSDLSENKGYQVITRNGKLYDKLNHTYTWPAGQTLKCDVVWLFDFVDVPQPFKDYIIAKSSVIASTKMIGDTDQFKLLRDRENTCKAMILQYECEQGNYSMFGFPQGENYYSSYQPFKTLSR
jgi:hypothetical protein